MCRLLAYMGAPIVIDQLLYQPSNSLITQSSNAKEIEEPLNGDGFGIGWYVSEANYEPVTFVSVNPAWNNRNLRNLAPKIRTECLLAHVRAATVGDVSESNCHPFLYNNLLMCHNGGIENFSRIKRALRSTLDDEVYNWIKGQTDSEHIFASLVNYLKTNETEVSPESVMRAFEVTFNHLNQLMQQYGINEPAYYNMVVTNGLFIVGTRYVSDPREEALTLYHSSPRKFVCEEGVCHMRETSDSDGSVLVVSEKLTQHVADWVEVPKNHFVVVTNQLEIRTAPIHL